VGKKKKKKKKDGRASFESGTVGTYQTANMATRTECGKRMSLNSQSRVQMIKHDCFFCTEREGLAPYGNLFSG